MTYQAPDNINPTLQNSLWNTILIVNLFDGLLVRDAHGQAIPGLAESWDVSENNTKYEFHIRDNAYWSDGTAITAEGIAESFITTLSLPNTSWKLFQDIVLVDPDREGAEQYKTGIYASDDNVLTIKLKTPVRYLLQLLSDVIMVPLPVHAFDKFPAGDAWPINKEIPVSGAYSLYDVQATTIQAQANPYYYDRENLEIHDFTFNWNEGSDQQIYRYVAAGEVDLGIVRAAQQSEFIKGAIGEYVVPINLLTLDYLAFNTENYPLNQAEIRRALSMAVDHDALQRLINSPEVAVSEVLLPKSINDYPGDVFPSWHNIPYLDRLDMARDILKEAGYDAKDPLTIDMAINFSTLHERVATAIRSMWSQIDVDAEITVRNLSEHYENVRAKKFDVARVGWGADINDPQDFLSLFQTNARSNYAYWSNAEFDDLVFRAQSVADRDDAKALQREALAIAQEEASRIPLYSQTDFQLVNPNLLGVYSKAVLEFPVRWMSFKNR